jgi:predicted ATPase/DNA-binding SARP family transcriptional activator/pimeloyl-ACP methyl ester carboxylesterase
VEFGLLGPLTVVDGGSDLTPARPKQRALLALLLLRRGAVVPGAQLIEALWGEEPPGTAQTALHGHVSALRKLLGPERIRTRPPGYMLDVSPGEVDLGRFEALVAQARGHDDPAARSACLREALALWRGEPLTELRGEPVADLEIARLVELRVTALEDRIEADLALGRHHELVSELEPLVAEHPFRERLRGELMLALYRCGRQVDALQVYQSGRRALVEELGIDPGPALRQLELGILRQDPSLELPAPAAAAPAAAPRRAPVRYARSGDLNIAYQVTGDGQIDLVLISGFISHLEKDWEEPRHAHFLERLGSIARLIRFDKRGTGLSDRPAGVPDLETRMDDVRAVMDAVDSRNAVLLGYSEAAPMAILFAASYPERTRALILYGAYAKRLDPDDDYPWAPTREARAAYINTLERDWGFESDMKAMCPSADEPMARWWGERCRAAASPGAIRALNEMNSLIDVRALLPAIHVPTLVVHRGTDYDVHVEEGRYIAERIPGARFVELPGADHFVGIDPDQIVDVVEPFLAECGAAEMATPDDRVLVTLLATDVVERHREVVRTQLARFRGREIEPSLAIFDGPGRAVRCATAIVHAFRSLGLGVRAGVHTGEVEVEGDRVRGVAVDVVARVAAAAAPGEVLVTQTVNDVMAGSGLEFTDRGSRALEGVPGQWRLLAAVDPDRSSTDAVIRGDRSGELASRRGATNLPLVSSPLVGRERELEELVAMLLNGTRLLTITGPGGTGKTRLALQVAAELAGRLHDGVYWVSLAGLTDPELVTSELARTVGAPDELAGFLRGKELLLLLDNFEHLLAAAPVVSGLLAGSGRVRVLVTSRAPLRVSGEQEYRLEPLPRKEAAMLFAERARAVGCEVAPDATVEEICRRLDDLPLAIELAAARTKLLAPQRLLGRLDSALALLTTGARDAPERQRTLRATIEWSYDLLDPSARELFARLSVFSGAFPVEAAEEVCGAELDDLSTLVDYSLVKPIGDDHFSMLETIGSYAREKLTQGSGEDDLRRRHAAFFSGLAEQAYRHRFDAEAEWSSRLERQHDDLRAALDWLSARDPDRALELAGALGWFWLSRGLLREGRRRLSAALSGSGMTGRSRARALVSSGSLLARHGDAAAGIAELDAAVAMWQELGDLDELASALDSLGWPLVYDAANNSRALAAFERSLELWRELRDEAGVTRALVGIAQVLVAKGETERAEAISLDLLARAGGDARTEHYAYHFLADCALIRGDPEEARTRYRHSLQAALALGDVLETGWEVQGVAMSEAGTGNPRRAVVLAGSVEALWESLGFASSIAFWDALLERYLAPARASLGDEYAAVRAEGRALAFDHAVELALNDHAQLATAKSAKPGTS